MLDRMTTADVRGFSVIVHREVPLDWPSVRDRTDVAKRHVFQTREYIEAWMATRGMSPAVSVHFVEVRDAGDRPVMLLPLTITSSFAGRTLGFMDAGLADYNAPVLFAPGPQWTAESAAELWEKILSELPVIDLIKIENMPAAVDGEVNPLALIATGGNSESAHGSDLTQAWETLEATQPQLKTLKRKQRALEKVAPVSLVVATGDAEIERVLTRMLAEKQRRFDDTKVSGFDRDPAKLAYFKQATSIFAAAGRLQLCALLAGDEIVATAWSLVQGDRVYEVMIGFEAGEWTKYSCSRILNLMMLRHCKEQGYAYLDHGIGDEDWKLASCDRHVALYQLAAPRSWRGRLMVGGRQVRNRLRKLPLWRALQPIKWALLRRRSGLPN